MASSCASCGAELIDGARFCAQCGTPVSLRCAGCGGDLPPGARFCPACGTPVGGASTPATEEPVSLGPGEERKVISVLFADLVGFTSHTEASDPEDVKRRLVTYHRLMREHVERHGGRVEKLMGDGVFAVFGVPAAHEDDPERAVRSALRFQETQAAQNLGFNVRIAITTGEAVVQLDRSDQDREGIIGDVVNTASRLEGHSPPGGVVVDERTYRSTSALFEYRPLPAVDLKGKEGLTSIWLAEAPRTRYGVDVDPGTSTPFIGRDHELAIVTRSFERAVSGRSLQMVTVSGEPGSGKSRLVDEFLRVVDERPDLVWWRQGRCLPYGDGITFWALGEVVKAQAGILDSDDPTRARGKLAEAVGALIEDGAGADWVTTCLVPLAGVGPTPTGVERDELFRGWLRFIEALASKRPLVMVIEDLHWADAALVEFLEFLVRRSLDSPILLLVTARPELFSAHPDWSAGLRNAASVALAPLADADAAALLGALLPGRLMDAEAQERLLERCGGNPLHLVEFVRLAAEQGELDRLGDGTLPVPDSVQAVVAARLDLLGPEEKAVLQTAAVVGKVFWDGALAFALPIQRTDIRSLLEALADRELVRPIRQSTLAGEEEWAFSHSMIRDVAYGQLPRSDRRARHEAVARWMEAVAGERAVDVAEVLAHHYAAALEGLDDPPGDLRERAYAALMAAGRRARSLDARRAAAYFREAAAMAESSRDQGRAWHEAADLFMEVEPSREAAWKAVEAFRSAGLPGEEAKALVVLSSLEWFDGNGTESRRVGELAIRLVEDLPDSLDKGIVLLRAARSHLIRGEADEAYRLFELGRPSIDAFADAEARVGALTTEGQILTDVQDDPRGLELLERAVRVAEDRGMTSAMASSVNNLETVRHFALGSAESLAGVSKAIDLLAERGQVAGTVWSLLSRMEFLLPMGRWDEVLVDAERAIELAEAHGGEQVVNGARAMVAAVDFYRGGGSIDDVRAAYEMGLELGDPQAVAPNAALLVMVAGAAGRLDEAAEAADALCAVVPHGARDRALLGSATWLVALGRVDDLERLTELDPPAMWAYPRAAVTYGRGVVAQARRRFVEAESLLESATEALEGMGHRWDGVLAGVQWAEVLDELGRSQDAAEVRKAAREVALDIGADRAVGWLDRGSPLAAAG